MAMSSTTPDLKPLYLDGVQPLAVKLDGPALKVMQPGRSPGRYPLRRLSRVVVSGAVDWDTPALIACLRAGVVVTFLDEDGELAGLCVGAATGGVNLRERLAEFALRPDWPEYYANWYAAMERRGILGLVNRLSLRVDDLRPATVRRCYAQRLAGMASPRVAQRVVSYLEAALAACAARTAADCGIPAALLTDEGQDYRLTRDLGRLLGWEARVLAARLLGKDWPQGMPRRSDLASAVERRMGRYIRLVHEQLNYLERAITALNYGDEG